jgi:hypothetical protein
MKKFITAFILVMCALPVFSQNALMDQSDDQINNVNVGLTDYDRFDQYFLEYSTTVGTGRVSGGFIYQDTDTEGTVWGLFGEYSHLFYSQTAELPVNVFGGLEYIYNTASSTDVSTHHFLPQMNISRIFSSTSGTNKFAPYVGVLYSHLTFTSPNFETDTYTHVGYQYGLDVRFSRLWLGAQWISIDGANSGLFRVGISL